MVPYRRFILSKLMQGICQRVMGNVVTGIEREDLLVYLFRLFVRLIFQIEIPFATQGLNFR